MDMIMHGFLQTPVVRKLSIESPSQKWINTIASNAFFFAVCIWLIISVIIFGASLIFNKQLLHDLRWYGVLGIAMAFYNVCWWIGNGCSNFKAVFIQRLLFVTVSGIAIALFIVTESHFSVSNIILAQVTGYAVSASVAYLFISKITLRLQWLNIGYLKFFFNYGKFTSGSMLMGSLLRNADIFMIDAFMGQSAVAIYGTAQKTVEIFEVALRGMASHALPEFCKAARNTKALMEKYVKLTSLIFLIILPLAFFMFIFSGQAIRLLSGSTNYSAASIILKVFMAYVLFLVTDRMTGVTLEAMGLARYNLIKTLLLVIVNVVGNAIALYYFKSLAGVACVSILAAATGIISGWYFILINSGLSITRHRIRTGFNLVLR
jgi:O-antigen/teichoic acid export membrane protein